MVQQILIIMRRCRLLIPSLLLCFQCIARFDRSDAYLNTLITDVYAWPGQERADRLSLKAAE
ncbi:hypothetical protein GCM10007385_28250 [Tateyamaria omphalii]|nr:hypothetical protein GCM10007385_28250 [Tateyamaria omphalii]